MTREQNHFYGPEQYADGGTTDKYVENTDVRECGAGCRVRQSVAHATPFGGLEPPCAWHAAHTALPWCRTTQSGAVPHPCP